MSERSNRLRIYAFSIEILQDIITEGWQIGDDAIVRCTSGLPPGAKFEYVYEGIGSTVCLVFSHPSWPEVGRYADPPRHTAMLSRIERTPAPLGVSTEGAAWASEAVER